MVKLRKLKGILFRREVTRLGSVSSENSSIALALLVMLAVLRADAVWSAEDRVADIDSSRLNKWLCANLHAPFDFKKAVQSFPFERMGKIVESEPKLSDDKTAASVEFAVEGKDFTLEYRYQYKLENVSKPYGFSISVDRDLPYDQDPTEFPKEWLATIGKAKYDVTGYAVGFGKQDPRMSFLPPPASFAYWTTGRIVAAWFHEQDIEAFGEPCGKIGK